MTPADVAVFNEIKFGPESTGRTDRMPRIPQNASSDITALKQKLEHCITKVNTWNEILTEMTQSVFVLCATTTTDSIPFYADVPSSMKNVAAPVGRLALGEKVTLMNPQVVQSNFIFMRLRRVDPRSGDVTLYYTPIANQSMTQQQLSDVAGIQSDADQYFDWFHNPGDVDPNPSTQGTGAELAQ